MANDRIFIACNKCHSTRLLNKYYPAMSGGMDLDGRELTKWMDDHIKECQEWFDFDLQNDPRFHLITEHAYFHCGYHEVREKEKAG